MIKIQTLSFNTWHTLTSNKWSIKWDVFTLILQQAYTHIHSSQYSDYHVIQRATLHIQTHFQWILYTTSLHIPLNFTRTNDNFSSHMVFSFLSLLCCHDNQKWKLSVAGQWRWWSDTDRFLSMGDITQSWRKLVVNVLYITLSDYIAVDPPDLVEMTIPGMLSRASVHGRLRNTFLITFLGVQYCF